MMRPVMFAMSLLLVASNAWAAGVKSEIDDANRKFGVAYDKGDAAAIARLYTPHATVLPPGSDIVVGRDGIQKVWAETIQSGLKFKGLQTIGVEQYGDFAREIGRFTAEAPNAEKQLMPLEGKYVVVWKRVNGSWMLDTDIWNLNK